MENQPILDAMRAMAWERAKGELRSISPTFFLRSRESSEVIRRRIDDHDNRERLIEEFIKNYEGTFQ